MHVALAPASIPLRGTATAPSPGATRSFGAVLDGHRISATPAPHPDHSPARLALDALERARHDLDGAVAAARTGRTFSPSELLALQSQAYRYSQAVEVATKVVEQATQAVKQAVNTQV